MQTRIAGLLATGALIVLGPASVAGAASTPASGRHVTHASFVRAASASAKAGEHAPQKSKAAHGKSKAAHGKKVKTRKHGKKSSGPQNAKHKNNKPKTKQPKINNPHSKGSNARGSGVFHGRTSTPSAPAKSHGKTGNNGKKQTTKRSPSFQQSSSSSSSASSARFHSRSSGRVVSRGTTTHSAPAPLSTPQPTFARAVAAPARPAPITAGAVQPARTTSRTPAAAAPTAASSSAAAGAPVTNRPMPPDSPGSTTASPVERAFSPIPLGADAERMISIIGIVGFAVALAAIVTGYRGARRV